MPTPAGVARGEPDECDSREEAELKVQEVQPVFTARQAAGTLPEAVSDLVAESNPFVLIQRGDYRQACDVMDRIALLLESSEEEPTPIALLPSPTVRPSTPARIPKVIVPTCPLDSRASAAKSTAKAAAPAPPDNETRIAIDGRADDWAERDVLLDDPVGDAEAGFPDLTTGRAFVNQHALYLLIDVQSPEATFDSFEIDLQTGSRRLFIAWSPRWGEGPFTVADTTTEWREIAQTTYSSFALDSAMEARIDLRDLGSPEEVSIGEVRVMAGTCCNAPEWRAADRWSPDGATPTVDEVDPSWRLARKGGAREAERTLSAPDTRAIALDYDPTTRRVQVAGGAGAVPEGTTLLVGNLELNDFTILKADGQGRFETDIVGAPGSHVLIKQDTTGQIIQTIETTGENNIAPGVLLRIPVEEAEDGIAFGAAARLCCNDEKGATWAIEGVYERDALQPGDQMRVAGRLSLLSGPSARPPNAFLVVSAYLLSDADGRQVGRAGKFVTPFLTATGLPIERALGGPPLASIFLGGRTLSWRLDGERWVADFDAMLRVPSDIRAGLYALTAGGLYELEAMEQAGTRPFVVVIRDQAARLGHIGTIAIGEPAPMRLATTLLADDVSEGSHGGVIAREDRDLFGISGRAAMRHQPVVPRLDGYGEPWSYRLEPYAPMVDVVDRSLPTSPSVTFDFPNSELTVTIDRPDGKTDVLGPAPLARYAVKSPRTPWNLAMGLGGGELREIAQLQGIGDTFAYRFPLDGDYVITINGEIADHGGREYGICGTYDVTVANVLDIETSMLPTTPFEVGDSVAPTLTIMPGVPAGVTYTITQVAADGETTARTFRGRANDNGWWDGDGGVWTFKGDGEYRVDIEARYAEPEGALWVGRLRFGSAVATPDAPMIVHGRRGSDGVKEIPRPWGLERDLALVDEGAPHMHFPYFTGDILWGMDKTEQNVIRPSGIMAGEAVVTVLSMQSLDDDHPLMARAIAQVDALAKDFPWLLKFPLDSVLQAGQMPLVTGVDLANRGRGAHPDEIDLWAYVYSSAERPGVRVREVIEGDDVSGSYWRFGDAYYLQSGNGFDGDLPADFKFMYGAAVIRDTNAGEGVYAIYGSGWVLLPEDDQRGARFMPPFQGAAGGPDGGPLFTVHGREVDIFFLPLGVRPGAVLGTGDTFRIAGPIMPTLPSLVEYTVTAPDGTRRTLGGRANAVGYFYDPDDDFVLDQPGLWTVALTVTHDGLTSAGPVGLPYPTGGPLTPDGATFIFVVTDRATQPLNIETDLAQLTPAEWSRDVRRASFEAELPAGWSGDTARVIVTMPGIVLVDEDMPVAAGAIRWDLDAQALNRLASNFDCEAGIADTITVTFYAEGTLDGQPTQAAGTIVTHGARVPRAPIAAE